MRTKLIMVSLLLLVLLVTACKNNTKTNNTNDAWEMNTSNPVYVVAQQQQQKSICTEMCQDFFKSKNVTGEPKGSTCHCYSGKSLMKILNID